MANYIKRKYRRRGVGKSKKAVVRKALRKNSQQKVAKVCKRVISNMAEVKSNQTTYITSPRNQLAAVADLPLNNVFMVSPNTDINPITQGTTSESRSGNKIRTKYCKARIIITPNDYDATNNTIPKPVIVKFWCVTPKDGYYSASEMATAFKTSFFQDGNTSQGYSSNLVDLVSTVNKDVFTLHWSKSYKLGYSSMYAVSGTGGSGTQPSPYALWQNNDYKMNHIINFDFTKHIQKTFTYNDNAVTPNGKSTFLIVGLANADGTPFTSAAGQNPVGLWAQFDYGFTDM